MDELTRINHLIHESLTQQAIEAAERMVAQQGVKDADKAQAYYLMGNAYRQLNDFRRAMGCYLEAVELDPESPAAAAYEAAQQVLGFYDHDLYNP